MQTFVWNRLSVQIKMAALMLCIQAIVENWILDEKEKYRYRDDY